MTLHNYQLLALVLVGLVAGMLIMHVARDIAVRRNTDRASEEESQRREYADRKERQLRDQQLNHGRRVYNWLRDQLREYGIDGIGLGKIEDNGGTFSILITRRSRHSVQAVPVVEISYDFVGQPSPYLGHVHYGAYGADMLFWVGEHAPFNGLDRIVLREVEEEVARLKLAQ